MVRLSHFGAVAVGTGGRRDGRCLLRFLDVDCAGDLVWKCKNTKIVLTNNAIHLHLLNEAQI